MKIIHILLGKANPDRMNGVNKVVHQMAIAQQQKGLDVTVIGITSKEISEEIRPYLLYLFKANPWFPKIPAGLQQHLSGKCLIHFHGVLIPVFYKIAQLLVKQNIPYVVTPHGALQRKSLEKSRIFKTMYIQLFEKRFLAKSKAVHAITAKEKLEIQLITGKDKPIPVIQNAYPEDRIASYTAPKNKEIIFGYIGRLDKQHKGLDNLIAAFAIFYRRQNTGYLWIVGHGPHYNDLQIQAQILGIQSRVIFFGEKHSDEKTLLLRQMDVFVHPSRWDVLPTSILEAAAYGRPLIVSKETGFADAVNKFQSGYVLSDIKPVTTAECFQQCFEHYGLKTLNNRGQNARLMIKQDFNWSVVVQRIIQCLYGFQI